MAMGLPVFLVSPEGEASELIQSHGAGMDSAGDPILFSDAISSLFEDKSKCEILAKASLDAAPKHSRENQARKCWRYFSGVCTDE